MISEINEFSVFGDDRGNLIALEAHKDIPFDVKRVFYIYGVQKNLSRGHHAHYKTKQLLIVLNGSCKVTLDDGIQKETFSLNRRNLGLFQDAMIWSAMHEFSKDCVLLVLADRHYDESDYIRDYDYFIKEVSK